MKRIVVVLIVMIAATYGAAVGYLYFFQRSFVFEPSGALASPSEHGLDMVEVVTITTADGTRLTGWSAEPQAGRPSILYFHGNAGNISTRADRFQKIVGSGFGLLAMSYRGYPDSEGSPSEAALFSDALEIFDWLAARTETIVIHGESLGTGVATYVATERPAAALVLEAPFTAALDVAQETYPWVPVALLMYDPFISRDRIGRVEEPLLIVHGTKDRVVPTDQGRRLFEAAGEPKQLAIFEGGIHSDLWDRELWPTVLEFLERNGVAPQLEP
jgi:hypothetical protein